METTVLPAKKRIDSIDTLRGIIMIIMALDHVRDFFHIDAMTGNPTDPATTTPILFFTRWITHFCAPVFVFLAGTAAFLAGTKRTRQQLSAYLIKRGLWLMLLDICIFNLIFSFDPQYHFIGLEVIWVTGISMIILAVVLYLPLPLILLTGAIIVAGHNFLDGFNAAQGTTPSMFWSLLHQQSFRPLGEGRLLAVLYPLLPWPGLMLLGYGMGTLFAKSYDPVKRRKMLTRTGIILVLVFLLLRWANIYGDLVPWSGQKNTPATVMSFFNLTKYPPSLLFCCMTIGPALILLAWLEKTTGKWKNYAVIYGRVPLFYYLFHFFVIHLTVTIIYFVNGHKLSEAGGMILFRPADFGYPLGVVYLIWIALVTALYPVCKWYSKYKGSHDYWWLTYL
jgi:uncharacterized membrane protein